MKNEHDFDFTKIKKVKITDVQANEWNPKDKDTKEYHQVVRSIKTNGLRDPIIVREVDGHYEVIDGEQRYTAAKELGYKEIYVYNEGQMSEKEAKALTIWYQVQVPFNDIDLSHLVIELADLQIELPYTDGEIADFRNMADFDFSQYKDTSEDVNQDDSIKTLSIKMMEDQYAVVMDTIKHVMNETDSNEARALELIIADYRASAGL